MKLTSEGLRQVSACGVGTTTRERRLRGKQGIAFVVGPFEFGELNVRIRHLGSVLEPFLAHSRLLPLEDRGIDRRGDRRLQPSNAVDRTTERRVGQQWSGIDQNGWRQAGAGSSAQLRRKCRPPEQSRDAFEYRRVTVSGVGEDRIGQHPYLVETG